MKHDKDKARRLNKDNKVKQDKINSMGINLYLQHPEMYVMAGKVSRHYELNLEPVRDIMRQAQAFVHQIRHQQLLIENYKRQYEENNILEKNKYDKIMTKAELYSQLIVERINIPMRLSQLRDLLTHKLAAVIDNVFTPKMYDDFLVSADKVISDLGEELFSDKVELLKIE